MVLYESYFKTSCAWANKSVGHSCDAICDSYHYGHYYDYYYYYYYYLSKVLSLRFF